MTNSVWGTKWADHSNGTAEPLRLIGGHVRSSRYIALAMLPSAESNRDIHFSCHDQPCLVTWRCSWHWAERIRSAEYTIRPCIFHVTTSRVWYITGQHEALHNITLAVSDQQYTATGQSFHVTANRLRPVTEQHEGAYSTTLAVLGQRNTTTGYGFFFFFFFVGHDQPYQVSYVTTWRCILALRWPYQISRMQERGIQKIHVTTCRTTRQVREK